MGRSQSIICGFVRAVCIAWYWGVVIAQSGEAGQPDASVVDSSGRRCVRYWWTTMWGFVVTLVALTMDVWGFGKMWYASIVLNVMATYFLGVLNPLFMVFEMLCHAISGMAMVGNLRGALGYELVVPLWSWRKSKIKIVVGTHIIVNLSASVHMQVSEGSNVFSPKVRVRNFLEAIVIGTKVEDPGQHSVQLSNRGKLALLRANILPPYDQLKILRGNSTLGMIVAAAQAIGYIYAIGVRC